MIKQKKKICKNCGKETYIFSKGRCKNCALKTYNPLSSINRGTKKESYTDFFNQCLNTLPPIDEETKHPIYNFSKFNICHILPKRRYKSVAKNIDNIVVLSIDNHTRFDYLLDTMQFNRLEKEFPNIWNIIKERLIKVIPQVTESGKLLQNLKEYFNII